MDGTSMELKTRITKSNPNEIIDDITSHLINTHNDKIIDTVINMIDDSVFNNMPECLLNICKDMDEEVALKEMSNNYLKEGMRE